VPARRCRGAEKKKAGALEQGTGSRKAVGRSGGVFARPARFYCAAGKPWIFIPGLMPFDVNQPLLISNAYTPLFFGQ
jgi:hypothetical protein